MNERAPKSEQPLHAPEMNSSKEEQPQHKINRATPEDIEQLKDMFRDNEEAQESYEESFSQQKSGEGAFYIAKDDKGEIAGYATVLYEYKSAQIKGIKGSIIEDVRVFPNHQRQGLGSKIIQACEEQIRSRGQNKIILSVRHDNEAAITMYAKNGYHEIPNSRFEPSDPNLPGSLEVQGFYMEKKLSRPIALNYVFCSSAVLDIDNAYSTPLIKFYSMFSGTKQKVLSILAQSGEKI